MDKKDIQIIAELIQNPAKTNAAIEKSTGIPEKTIARRRQKCIEKDLNIYLEVNNTNDGTGIFQGTASYNIFFQNYITRNQIIQKMNSKQLFASIPQKHLKHAYIGDSVDKIQLTLILESFNHDELIEILNADIIPNIKEELGEHAIHSITKTDNIKPLILFNNYNLVKGKPQVKNHIYVTE